MYAYGILVSLGLTVLSAWLVLLVEKKIGRFDKKRPGLTFAVPVFILFLAGNLYMVYTKAEYGNCLLMNILLMTTVVSSYQDLKYREIEDEIHIAALAAGLIGLLIKGFKPMDSFLGLIAGGGFLLITAILTKGGMGGADIKLNGVYGVILGLKLSVLSLIISFSIGAIISLLMILLRIKSKKDVIPFSPFLSFGALTSFVFGEGIISMYLNLLYN